MKTQQEARVPLLDDDDHPISHGALIPLSSDESEDDLLLLERLDPKGKNGIQYKRMGTTARKSNRNRWLVILLVAVVMGEYV